MMTSATENRVAHLLLAGLPETGKTSFIAALWHVVQRREVPGALQLVRLQDETKYLNTVLGYWINFEPMPHTQAGTVEPILLVLRDETGNEIEISFPDVSGEAFVELWRDRQWEEALAARATQADAILVFTHPSHAGRPRAHVEDNTLLEHLPHDEGCTSPPEVEEETEEKVVPYSPDLAAKQAQFVDWLQNIRSTQSPAQAIWPLRVGLIVSAWDEVQKQGEEHRVLSPQEWLEKHFPLLWQFLRANRLDFDFQVWGLSAYGGNVKNPVDLARLQNEVQPAKRIALVEGDAQKAPSHDITVPLRWAMQSALERADD